jgi:hypothetical protein
MNSQTVKALLTFLIFANIGIYGTASKGAVWETRKNPDGTAVKWSDPSIKNPDGTFLKGYTWDDTCSDWIREKANEHIFDHVPFKHIPDCGKSANLLHLRCAMEFNLPYALNGNKAFSNSITTFDQKYPDPEARKLAFLIYISEQPTSGSESIPGDTYPVKINIWNVHPGTLGLFLADNGPPDNDTYTATSIGPTGVIKWIKGTSNSQTNTLFLAQSISGEPNHLRMMKGFWRDKKFVKGVWADGIRNWRHYDEARGSYIPLSEEKGYDEEEEYSDAFRFFADSLDSVPRRHTWEESIEHAMQKYEGDVPDHIEELLTASCGLMINREIVVSQGEAKRQELGGYLDPIRWDGFFTRKRDSNLADRLSMLENFLVATGHTGKDADGHIVNDPFKNYRDVYFAQCAIPYGPDRNINLAQFQELLLPEDGSPSKVSSDANQCLAKKWGMGECESSIAQNRN